jgi:ZIP family zinc transporter
MDLVASLPTFLIAVILISASPGPAVAFVAWVSLLVLIGAAVLTAGGWLLTRSGGGDRKDARGAQEEGSPLAIVLGSILDGIPESFVLGLTVLEGGVPVEPARGHVVLQRSAGRALAAATGRADG